MPVTQTPDPANRWPAVALRMALRAVLVVAVVIAVKLLIGWLEDSTHTIGAPTAVGVIVVAALLLAYAALIAVPFVPGIEIGIALMFLQGGAVAPFVYLATVAGLFVAYFVGARVPYAALHRLFADLRLGPACRMLERVAPLSPEDRLELLRAKLPRWIGDPLIRHRYILLGVLVNVPGNGVVGGGGGLSLLAGFSRLYRAPAVALTLAIAVAPVPLLVWWFDRPVLPLPG